MKQSRISKDRVREMVPKKYQNYAGIGPYYLPIFGKMYWNRLKMAIRLIPNANTQEAALTIGDMGSGFGIFVVFLGSLFPKSKMIGLDIYQTDVLRISKVISNDYGVTNTDFIRGDILTLPFDDRCFDMLFALDILEHVPDPTLALHELSRVLKENGTLIIAVPLESNVLVFTRRLYALVKRGCPTSPRWNGTIKSFEAFCKYVEGFFKIEKKSLFPINLLGKNFNYDCFFVCRNRQDRGGST